MGNRVIALFSTMIVLFSLLIIRLYAITQSDYLVTAAQNQSSYTLKIARTRGAIYDRNLAPITGQRKQNLIAVLPSADSISAVAQTVTGPQRSAVLSQMEGKVPFTALLEEGQGKVYSADVENFTVTQRYPEEPFAPHILGYLDGEGHGVMGVEKAYDSFLRAAGEQTKVTYTVDGRGLPLENSSPVVHGSTRDPRQGVVLTLDREIQRIASQAARQIEEGAVVVMDVQTGQLRACVSAPEFSPYEVPAALEDQRSPLFNRAFAAYSVGSTYKLAVAAAALEQGISTQFSHNCLGGIEVDGRMFYCHNRGGHRQITMRKAIEQSCNPYFVALGQETGAENILYMSQAMGFGTATTFAPGMASQAGNLPLPQEVQNRQALANLSFGQGSLLATPVQIGAMVSSIANGGMAVTPSLVMGATQDGQTLEALPQYAENRIMSSSTARTLREFMVSVVEEGSGTPGKPEWGGAGGKTASAQTGKLAENGEEIVHAWFAGFFPAEEPRYAVVVLVEGGEFGGQIASPIFREIADQINLLEGRGE